MDTRGTVRHDRWMKQIVLAGLIVIGAAGDARPQSILHDPAVEKMVGTTSAAHVSSLSAGKLSGCTIQFNVMVRDWQSRNGGLDKISGSFGFLISGKSFAPVLKLSVNEFELSPVKLTPNTPTRAYVVDVSSNNFSSSIKNYSEMPGAYFVIFQLEPTTTMYMRALQRGQLDLRYGRQGAHNDVPFIVDLRVQDMNNNGDRLRSDKTIDEMSACVSQMVKDLS